LTIGPSNEIIEPCNMITGLRNVIMGPSIVNMGQWNVVRGPVK